MAARWRQRLGQTLYQEYAVQFGLSGFVHFSKFIILVISILIGDGFFIMRVIILFTALAMSLFFIGCGGGTIQPNTNIVNNTNTPKTNTNNNPLFVPTPTPESTTNNAPTLSPVYKAYCDARVKNDEAALRRIYSSDAIRYFEEQMKQQKVKTISKYLEDEPISGKVCEVRNEQITGDKAIAEVRTEAYPNGVKTSFVKENGEWKLTGGSPVLDLGKPPAGNSNKAK